MKTPASKKGKQIMTFFKILSSDFRRMFLSWKFYIAVLGIAGLTFLSIWPEVTATGYRCSVYYLVSTRGGLGAFFKAFTVLIVLPYSLSYWEDVNNNYIYSLKSRTGVTMYCWSHTLTAATGAFLTVFLGCIICFGLLAIGLPVIRPDELEVMQEYLEGNALGVYDTLILQQPRVLYFIAEFSTEALGYSFLAVFALIVSAKIENAFILLSMPVMFYQVSILLCNILDLPGIFRWYYIMGSGGFFSGIFTDIRELMVCVFLYFGGLICLECFVFVFCLERRRLHG